MSQVNDKDEFLRLAAKHQSELFSYIYALLRNLHDTEDVHQQTLMTLWRKFDTFELGTNFLGWAVRTAQIEVLRFRDQRKKTSVSLSEQLLADLAEEHLRAATANASSDRQDALEQCLQKLSAEDRSLVDECYRLGCRMKEIAERLERSPQSLSNTMRRIRCALFECVQRRLASDHAGEQQL